MTDKIKNAKPSQWFIRRHIKQQNVIHRWKAYQAFLTDWFIPHKCVLCCCSIKVIKLNKPMDIAIDSSICHFCMAALPIIVTSCAICNTPLSNGTVSNRTFSNEALCGVCLNTQRHWDRCFAAFEYKDSIKQLIFQFKYNNKPVFGKLLASLLAKHLLENYDGKMPDYLIPVPMFKDRLKHRGFNQSLLLCKSLSRLINVPILDVIKKAKKTETQKGLSLLERRASVRNSFELKNEISLTRFNKKKIVIIDDVMTTGSTSSEIAKLLKKSGISNIEVWVLART